jgi:hypothetical protein
VQNEGFGQILSSPPEVPNFGQSIENRGNIFFKNWHVYPIQTAILKLASYEISLGSQHLRVADKSLDATRR